MFPPSSSPASTIAGPYSGTGAPELELDVPPEDELPPLDDVDEEEVDEEEELDPEDEDGFVVPVFCVSSLPPHAAMAVAPANRIAARVATRLAPPGCVHDAANVSSKAVAQNGHAVSFERT